MWFFLRNLARPSCSDGSKTPRMRDSRVFASHVKPIKIDLWGGVSDRGDTAYISTSGQLGCNCATLEHDFDTSNGHCYRIYISSMNKFPQWWAWDTLYLQPGKSNGGLKDSRQGRHCLHKLKRSTVNLDTVGNFRTHIKLWLLLYSDILINSRVSPRWSHASNVKADKIALGARVQA
jgi:hypothetical protein